MQWLLLFPWKGILITSQFKTIFIRIKYSKNFIKWFPHWDPCHFKESDSVHDVPFLEENFIFIHELSSSRSELFSSEILKMLTRLVRFEHSTQIVLLVPETIWYCVMVTVSSSGATLCSGLTPLCSSIPGLPPPAGNQYHQTSASHWLVARDRHQSEKSIKLIKEVRAMLL